ncbi:MAG: cation diffusion facilitator family transporter [Bacteroidales bacterium]|jgi:cation diffusion facilitator family transporter|nr:cation diffusion facilitator family transporter [Bacteroidales bacterium]HPB02598.1 cation diffusion facilitator family transporter [Bacteroidales bacterium]
MDEKHLHKHEKQTLWVVLLTAATMAVEIVFGLITNSMALLADGIHMGSHVLAIGMSWVAYIIVRRVSKTEKYKNKGDRILSLSAYTSGLLLLVFAFGIAWGAIQRINNPVDIQFREAILVACIGLTVNILSAILLHHNHEEEKDHNLQAAYLHVIADALTSVLAIAGLIIAMHWNIIWIDGVCALAGAVIISRWSIKLIVQSGKSLI